MGHIFINWMITVMIGSIVAPIFLAGLDPQIVFICLMVSALWSIPLIVIELTTWAVLKNKKHPHSWRWYSIIKYITAILTVVSLEMDFSDFQGAALPVLGFWGVPGLLMHFSFLRIRLNKEISAPIEKVVE